jgi:hypothetical protein
VKADGTQSRPFALDRIAEGERFCCRGCAGLDRWISDLEAAFEDRVLAVSSAVADCWAQLMVPDRCR